MVELREGAGGGGGHDDGARGLKRGEVYRRKALLVSITRARTCSCVV